MTDSYKKRGSLDVCRGVAKGISGVAGVKELSTRGILDPTTKKTRDLRTELLPSTLTHLHLT